MHRIALWLQEVLVPTLGPPGVFLVAFFDSSFLTIPEVNDIFVVNAAIGNPAMAWVYVLMTTAGSVSGSSLLWLVGRRGGEPLLVRRFGAQRVEQTRLAFRRWDVLALAVPALLPPPMPFKIFVFSSGVFGLPYSRFVATLFVARAIRYSIWGALGAAYGPQALLWLQAIDRWFAEHAMVVIPLFLLLLLFVALYVLRRRSAPSLGGNGPSPVP